MNSSGQTSAELRYLRSSDVNEMKSHDEMVAIFVNGWQPDSGTEVTENENVVALARAQKCPV